MTEPVRLLLARHGRTEWHRDNRYVSRTDIGIDETGREQARTLARRAKQESPSLVLSSPLKRALLTAGPAAEACGLKPETDDRLRELDFGEWEGKTFDEIRSEDPERAERFLESAEHGFPGGEPLEDGANRILAVFEDLRLSRAGATVLVVAHNTLLRLGLCAALGVPLGEYRRRLPRIVNGAVSEMRFGVGGGALYSLNDLAHAENTKRENVR
ncbi:histidine phosphatase family protein [Rubrobacter tropicus]|uniref:Histidine phosphatase family protein n=1 Tax=Rubrobacter tropicus TaxID=2653851 RepID=A0A6G8Q4V0_9ACTN|nr:histidine phosphatase family protein [Rubrobacter tropicus]QIN81502.1 histidine phosphatase family protein [Rubrobacter tropicus]